MCGFCVERAVIQMMELGQLDFVGEDGLSHMMLRESARAYRVGMPADSGRLEQYTFGGLGCGRPPEFGDMRLWIRREARRALWEAGQKDLAVQHDENEDFGPFLSWLLCSRLPEAIPYFDRHPDRFSLGIMWAYEDIEPDWVTDLRKKWRTDSSQTE